jgi:hypothetical protein
LVVGEWTLFDIDPPPVRLAAVASCPGSGSPWLVRKAGPHRPAEALARERAEFY